MARLTKSFDGVIMEYNVDDVLEDALPPLATNRKDGVPFPQANSLDCVLAIVLNTESDGSLLLSYVTRNVVNSLRQAAYYVNAAIYLGLCRKIGDVYYPSADGMRLQNAKNERRQRMLAEIALAHPVIGRWYTQIFRYETNAERINFLQTGFEAKLGMATLHRRCECVLSWMGWIQKHLPEL